MNHQLILGRHVVCVGIGTMIHVGQMMIKFVTNVYLKSPEWCLLFFIYGHNNNLAVSILPFSDC